MSAWSIAAALSYKFTDWRAAQVAAKIEQTAHDRKAFKPIELCISQYGPGERWTSRIPLACTGPARAVPNDVLSQPVAQ